jgi:glycosyltransferase involved in cell wall biosynthesis
MRILHFLGIGRVPKKPMIEPAGGIERVALELARIQVRRGAEVTVASMMPTAWRGTWEGVNLRHLRPHTWAKIKLRGNVRDFREHLSLTECVRLGRFDLVHLHEYSRTRFFEKQPKVMHIHNNPLDGWPDAELARAAVPYWRELGKAGAQIAVSAFVGKRLELARDRAGTTAPALNIVVNQSGVHADELSVEQRRDARERIRRELGLKDSDVFFLFAGAFRSEKGVVQLARAFSKLAAEHDNAFLAMAGGRDLWVNGHPGTEVAEAQVHAMLGEAVKQRRASFLGMLSPSALPSYYAAADVFVLPSMFQETFGLVILEAFAAGIPVIGARSGGIPELVQDGRNGLIVEQGDVDGLRDAMRRLLLDSELRKRLGSAGRQTAVSMTWENTVDRLERIYQGVLTPSQASVSRDIECVGRT